VKAEPASDQPRRHPWRPGIGHLYQRAASLPGFRPKAPGRRLGRLLLFAVTAGVVAAGVFLLTRDAPVSGPPGRHTGGSGPAGSASPSAIASKGGWVLSATATRGWIRVEVTAPGGEPIPNYCGGPGFMVYYVNRSGVAAPAPTQPLPQYCLAGSSRKQTFSFPVPRQPGRYRVQVRTRSPGPGGGGQQVTIPPTLMVIVGGDGRVELA